MFATLQKKCILALLLLLAILCGAQLDIFTPNMSEMRTFFGVSVFKNDLTLLVNLSFLGIAVLFCGVLVDKHSYRRLILLGLTLFMCGALMSTFATYSWQMIFGRIFQGLGAAAPLLLSSIVIIDMYPVKHQPKLLGLFSAIIAVSLAVSPWLITMLSNLVNWWEDFFILFCIALSALILGYFNLPKNSHKTIHKHNCNYIQLLKSSKIKLCVLTIGLFFVIERIFILSAHALYVDNFNITNTQLIVHEFFFLTLFVISGIWGTRLIEKVGFKKAYAYSTALFIFFIVSLLTLILLGLKSPALVTLSSVLFISARTFPLYVISALIFKEREQQRGRIQAMIIFFYVLATAIITQTITFVFSSDPIAIGTLIFFLVSGALYLSYFLLKDLKSLNDWKK